MLLYRYNNSCTPFGPHRAARHVDTAKSLQFHTYLWLGSPACVCSSAPIFLQFLWTNQSRMLAPQHFVLCSLFLGGRATCEHTVALHYLHSFSGQGSPADGYYNSCSLFMMVTTFNTSYIFFLVTCNIPCHLWIYLGFEQYLVK